MLGSAIDCRDRQRIATAPAKGGASMVPRQCRVDLCDLHMREFSGFSQYGEDGVIDVLRWQLLSPNRYVVEIGAMDGTKNNGGWLLLAEPYEGLMIKGDHRQSACACRNVVRHDIGSA